jgi:hypothetical protein
LVSSFRFLLLWLYNNTAILAITLQFLSFSKRFFRAQKKRSHLVYERFWYIDILCFDLHLMAIRTIFVVTHAA